MPRKGILFVISGPSGSGKTTLCRMVEKSLGIAHSVSYTTRPPRSGESEGKDYHFVSQKKFDEMIQSSSFLEWAQVHSNYYGTALKETEQNIRAGLDLILDLDTQGALAVKSRAGEAVLIFVDAPDDQILASRLGQRGTEAEEVKAKRLARAEHERKFKENYDYILSNDKLDKTLEIIIQIIEKERKLRGS